MPNTPNNQNAEARRSWTAPKLEKLGSMGDVAATGGGVGEVNPGGTVKFLAAS
jgi:hypothetical protein